MDHTRDRDFLFCLLLLSEENGFFFFGAAETEQKSEIREKTLSSGHSYCCNHSGMVDHPVNDVYSFHCADTQLFLFRSDVILLQGRPLEGRGSVQVRSGACLHAQRALAAAPQRLLDALAAEAVAAGRGRSRGDAGEGVEADRALVSLRVVVGVLRAHVACPTRHRKNICIS